MRQLALKWMARTFDISQINVVATFDISQINVVAHSFVTKGTKSVSNLIHRHVQGNSPVKQNGMSCTLQKIDCIIFSRVHATL